ncbi:MAG TPA: carboxypeptidase regulatory-like domain-containing protein [Vicinamibacterales bacterium]
MMRRVLGVALVAAAATAMAQLTGLRPAAQQPAAVRGRVEIGIPVAMRRPTSAYPARSVATPALAPASELRHVVVYLEQAPARPVTPIKVEIRQRSETFIPRVVAVTIGSEVSFPNDDPIYHNVFSLSRPRNFNLGRYPRGHTRRVQFENPGIVKVFCDIHSHMSATVMVFNHPWFAVPGEDGRFELPAVPAGEREITAWHERLGDTTQRVRVEAGRAAEADFVLPVPRE